MMERYMLKTSQNAPDFIFDDAEVKNHYNHSKRSKKCLKMDFRA